MRILVPLDGSDTALRVLLAIKRQLAFAADAEVHLLEVRDLETQPALLRRALSPELFPVDDDGGAALRRLAAEACEALERVGNAHLPGVHVVAHVQSNPDPAEAIVRAALALEVGMIAMATHGRSGLRHLLVGSVTEAVLRRSPVPVLIVGPGYFAVEA